MSKIIFNIGLNVGTEEPTEQLSNTLKALNNLYEYNDMTNIRVSENFGSWGKERVLVVEFNSIMTSCIPYLERLCVTLKQDAIAFTFNGNGFIAYNPNYKGKRVKFNADYFKVFREENKKINKALTQ